MSIREEIKLLPMDTSALRRFGLMVGFVFAAIGGFLAYKEFSWGMILVYVGGALMLLGAFVPKLLKPVYIGWMSMAVVLGFFMTRVILTIFFFVVLTPVGLFFRIIGRDALNRKIDRSAKTYWIPKEYPIADRTRFEKYF